jgi:hypothetical protein
MNIEQGITETNNIYVLNPETRTIIGFVVDFQNDERVSWDDAEGIEDAIRKTELGIVGIENKLEDRAASEVLDNEPVDPNWMRASRNALRLKKLLLAVLFRRRNDLRKHKSKDRQGTLADHFVQGAKRRLKPDTYKSLLDEAKAALMEAESQPDELHSN